MPVLIVGSAIIVAAIVANAVAAMADFTRANFALANSVRVGVPSSWLPTLGALKMAGAAGLLLGLLGIPYIGIARDRTGAVLPGSDRISPARSRAPPRHHHGRLLRTGHSITSGSYRPLMRHLWAQAFLRPATCAATTAKTTVEPTAQQMPDTVETATTRGYAIAAGGAIPLA